MKRHLLLILIIGSLGITQGCSVGMALSGQKSPNLNVIKKKATKEEIEQQLGDPVMVSIRPNGYTVRVYEYEVGNEPSIGRATGHAILDVTTLGLWEILGGIPIEGSQGAKYRVTITYNEHDEIVEVLSEDMIQEWPF